MMQPIRTRRKDIKTYPPRLFDFLDFVPPYGSYWLNPIEGLKIIKHDDFEALHGYEFMGAVECLVCGNYLVEYGFAFFRHDLIKDKIRCIELTERGRKLKDLHSIEDFIEWQDFEDGHKQRTERREIRLLVISIALLFSSIGSFLWDGSQFVNTAFRLTYDTKAFSILLFCGMCIGIAISAVVLELVKRPTKD